MYYNDSGYFGMHFFWWLFWILLWVSFFSMMRPVPRKKWQQLRETPKDILQRRLANGDISEKEYETRRELLSAT